MSEGFSMKGKLTQILTNLPLREPWCMEPPDVAVSAASPFLLEECDELLELLDVPLLLLLPLAGASKLMRAPRLYWGVALSRSLSM